MTDASDDAATTTAVQRAKISLERIAQTNHVFLAVNKEAASSRARDLDSKVLRGALHGQPMAIKDNIHVAGMPNTAGHQALAEFVPKTSATVVERLIEAGAIIMGKTNLHELAYGITSKNDAFGHVHNAVNDDYIAGGSSGGTAVAIAKGCVDMGLGTDTGGSCRIPAALNGICGFRPTTGRYPSDGVTRISSTRDTVGPLARNMGGIVVLDHVLSGGHSDLTSGVADIPANLSRLRLGVPRAGFYENILPEISTRMDALLDGLQAAGVTLVEADVPDEFADVNAHVGFPLVLYETRVLLKEYLAKNKPDLTLEDFVAATSSPDVMALMQQALVDQVIPEEVYRDAKDKFRPQLQAMYANYFEQHNVDAMIFPTTPIPAIPLADAAGDTMVHPVTGETVSIFGTYIQNTDAGSNAGIPGLSIPLDIADSGLPFGVEIEGPLGSDDNLLSIGLALETLIQQQNSSVART